MNRREFLTGTAGVATALTTGCLGSDDDAGVAKAATPSGVSVPESHFFEALDRDRPDIMNVWKVTIRDDHNVDDGDGFVRAEEVFAVRNDNRNYWRNDGPSVAPIVLGANTYWLDGDDSGLWTISARGEHVVTDETGTYTEEVIASVDVLDDHGSLTVQDTRVERLAER